MAKIRKMLGDISGTVGGLTFGRSTSGMNTLRRKPRASVNATIGPASAIARNRSQMAFMARAWSVLLPAEREAWRDWAANNPQPDGLGGTVILSGVNAFVKLNITRCRMNISAVYASMPPILLPAAGVKSLEILSLAVYGRMSVSWDHDGITKAGDYNEIEISGPYVSSGKTKSLKWVTHSQRAGDVSAAEITGLSPNMVYWVRVRYVAADGQTTSWVSGQSDRWSVLSVPDCLMWVRGDLGVTKGAGDAVSSWADQSGNGWDLLQATAAMMPIWVEDVRNGKPGLRFDGADDWLQTAIFDVKAQPITVFMVCKEPVNVSLGEIHLLSGRTGDLFFQFYYRIIVPAGYTIYCGVSLSYTVVRGMAWDVWGLIAKGATSRIRRNGVTVRSGNVGLSGLKGFTVGALHTGTYYAEIDVAEIVLYNRELTGVEIADVESYLRKRYAI